MAKRQWIALALLGLLSASAACAEGFVETYRVNAQYRGTVKKGFQDLGSGKVSYESLGGAAFRVRATGSVQHPREPKHYEFNIHERFEISGNALWVTSIEKMELDPNASPHRRRICEVIPFAYLVRYLSPPSNDGDPARHFTFEGLDYALRYRRTERHIEAELYRGDVFLGKFFLLADAGWRPAALEKFRIALPEEDMVVSFIVIDSYALHSARAVP